MNVLRIVGARSAKQSGIIGARRAFDPYIISSDFMKNGEKYYA